MPFDGFKIMPRLLAAMVHASPSQANLLVYFPDVPAVFMNVNLVFQGVAVSTCITSTLTPEGHSVPEYLALVLRLSSTLLHASGPIAQAVPTIFWAMLRAVVPVQDRLSVCKTFRLM
jgi:hypothetical protein